MPLLAALLVLGAACGYAKVSLLILDEIGFLGFDNLFPSAVCATALVERVIHHADVVTIEGESYRLRESETDAKARSPIAGRPAVGLLLFVRLLALGNSGPDTVAPSQQRERDDIEALVR